MRLLYSLITVGCILLGTAQRDSPAASCGWPLAALGLTPQFSQQGSKCRWGRRKPQSHCEFLVHFMLGMSGPLLPAQLRSRLILHLLCPHSSEFDPETCWLNIFTAICVHCFCLMRWKNNVFKQVSVQVKQSWWQLYFKQHMQNLH